MVVWKIMQKRWNWARLVWSRSVPRKKVKQTWIGLKYVEEWQRYEDTSGSTQWRKSQRIDRRAEWRRWRKGCRCHSAAMRLAIRQSLPQSSLSFPNPSSTSTCLRLAGLLPYICWFPFHNWTELKLCINVICVHQCTIEHARVCYLETPMHYCTVF